jgi:hypothetical protein
MSDGSGERGEKRRHIRNKGDKSRHQRGGEAGCHNMVKKCRERRPIAGDVDDENGLLMQPELPPRQDFDRFVECADTAWQHRKRIGSLGHDAFALMHVGDDDKVAQTAMGGLAMLQMHRDDPGDPATAGEHGVGKAAHQPVAAAAVDQLDPTRREPGPKLGRRGLIALIGTGGRTAIDAKPPNFGYWMLHAKPVNLLA